MVPNDSKFSNANPYASPVDQVWEGAVPKEQEVFEGEFQPFRTVWFAP